MERSAYEIKLKIDDVLIFSSKSKHPKNLMKDIEQLKRKLK